MLIKLCCVNFVKDEKKNVFYEINYLRQKNNININFLIYLEFLFK